MGVAVLKSVKENSYCGLPIQNPLSTYEHNIISSSQSIFYLTIYWILNAYSSQWSWKQRKDITQAFSSLSLYYCMMETAVKFT